MPQNTCSNCPYFRSYGEGERGRGTCLLFEEKSVNERHPQTQDCINTARDKEAPFEKPQRAATLNFTRPFYGKLIVISGEKRYPIAQNGDWCGCPGHQKHGHCYHSKELKRRMKVKAGLCPTLAPHLKTTWD